MNPEYEKTVDPGLFRSHGKPRTPGAENYRKLNASNFLINFQAANTIFVPDIFSRNSSGISRSMCMEALRPVQWVGTM